MESRTDVIKIFRKLYINRKFIVKICFLFTILGSIISFLLPTEFMSSTIFIPQKFNSKSSAISSVADLVGFNINSGSSSNEIPITMYPQVSESKKFKRLLLDIEVDNKKNLREFITEHYNLIENKNDSSDSFYLSKYEEKCFKILSGIVKIKIDQKNGFIIVESTMPIPQYSSIIAHSARNILQKIIIENRIESAKQNLSYSEAQLKEKMKDFNKIQNLLSNFKDSNLNIVSQTRKNKINKLEAEFEIIKSVVTELSIQVEQSKLEISRNTPVFSTIKEAITPNKRKSPNRKEIVISSFLLGFILSSLYINFKDKLKSVYHDIIEQS